MDTASLKSFATWARTALIREVTARIAVVLAPGSPERVEQPQAVGALEKAITTAGGGDKGRGAVADRVAYTWFNRIIAFRFMDANGYTGIGVVSPQAGVGMGQPEILAEAKRANIDPDVVSQKSQETVTALLNGTRRSDDPQGEAYALLLAEYCRHWNRPMPFMFERSRDFTELLIPANLLADDSVLSRAVKVMTEDVCSDVEIIGWLYQFYISERKDEVFGSFKTGKRAGAAEIPAATQLFTPHWIVRYLVENSLGRLWMLNHPQSRLVDQMGYYIAPIDPETDFLKINGPEDLKVIDPACGSGHMLTYAFDLLYSIYEEAGYAPSEIPRLILDNNLYGAEIDARAGALAAFALTMKARGRQRTFFKEQQGTNICVLEPIFFNPLELELIVSESGDSHEEAAFWNQFSSADTFGSLIQPDDQMTARMSARVAAGFGNSDDLFSSDISSRAARVVAQAEALSSRYAVVVANPPYLGSRKMAAELAEFLGQNQQFGQQDLYSAFIERGIGLVVPGGLVAMITMQSWMFLSTFEPLRRWLLGSHPPCVLAHLGTGAFDTIGGEVVSTAAFVLSRGSASSSKAAYIDATGGSNESAKSMIVSSATRRTGDIHWRSAATILGLPGAVFGYWADESLVNAFATQPSLSEIADVRQGLSTANDARFLRQWYEISYGRSSLADPANVESRRNARWLPCNKGGTYRRWYGNQDYVIDWAQDGKTLRENKTGAAIRNPAYYFRRSVSWSNIGGNAAFRYFPEGFIFNAKGMSLFPHDESQLQGILGYLNSAAAREALRLVAPINSIEVGHVAVLPVPSSIIGTGLIGEAVEIATTDWNETELSWGFDRSPVANGCASRLVDAISRLRAARSSRSQRLREIEELNNRHFADLLGLQDIVTTVDLHDVSLIGNEEFRYPLNAEAGQRDAQAIGDLIEELISYAVGCIFGRYSLDEPGLILADQGATLQDYLAKVPTPTFMPDPDNVIPVVDGDWFEDDIVTRFRQFLRAAFGEQHFEENLRFVTESLGVKDLRDYFVKSFYKDHVQRYKKRPIYWLFSSPKGSFNALIYMHRYTPSTVSTVLNEYLREFKAKLAATLGQQERLAAGGGTPRQQAAAQKEADRIRKMLLELDEYEHDVLYPLASQQIEIDLDDGVRLNYPKFGAALKKIPGLEAAE